MISYVFPTYPEKGRISYVILSASLNTKNRSVKFFPFFGNFSFVIVQFWLFLFLIKIYSSTKVGIFKIKAKSGKKMLKTFLKISALE